MILKIEYDIIINNNVLSDLPKSERMKNMGLFDNESKQHKQNMVALQNIVLDMNEKKLQVSEDFLDQMTKIYISKYMKVINAQVADLGKLTNIGLLYKKYDIIEDNINELVKIESLYKFNKPIPSEYKAQLFKSQEEFVNLIITKEWKKICPSSGVSRDDPNREKKCRSFFDSFETYESRMSESSLKLLKRLRDSVFPEKEETPQLVPDTDREAQAAEEGNAFVPEEFEQINASGTDEKSEDR